MKVYIDTGILIDYLAHPGSFASGLRSAPRRGRQPQSIFADADHLLQRISRRHHGATSVLTYYEVEEALYKQLKKAAKGVPGAGRYLVPAARAIVLQTDIAVHLFNIEVKDLTANTVLAHLRQYGLQTQGIRAADAVHLATAILFDANLIVSSDRAILKLDGILMNASGVPIRCLDSDDALDLPTF